MPAAEMSPPSSARGLMQTPWRRFDLTVVHFLFPSLSLELWNSDSLAAAHGCCCRCRRCEQGFLRSHSHSAPLSSPPVLSLTFHGLAPFNHFYNPFKSFKSPSTDKIIFFFLKSNELFFFCLWSSILICCVLCVRVCVRPCVCLSQPI